MTPYQYLAISDLLFIEPGLIYVKRGSLIIRVLIHLLSYVHDGLRAGPPQPLLSLGPLHFLFI
jgi:hypothetical protein